MNREEVVKELRKLNKTWNELDKKIREVGKQIISVKQELDINLEGLCVVNRSKYGDTYYKITVDRGDTIDYVYCSLHSNLMSLDKYQDKVLFLEMMYEVVEKEEFDKALNTAYNNLREL